MLDFSLLSQFKGEIAALTSAFLWAISSTIYTALGQKIQPIVLNLSKGGLAIVYILITFLILGETIPKIPISSLLLLLLSGAIGIGFGDTIYFAALNRLGARKTLLIQTIAPAIAALLGLLFLQEQLKIASWVGIFLTILGVATVIGDRTNENINAIKKQNQGIILALISALAQASGAILSRLALTQSDLSPLGSSLFRLIAGEIICLLILITQKKLIALVSSQLISIDSLKTLAIIALTAFGSTYLGIWLQQISLKFAATGIAQTLSSTSPLFVLPLTIMSGEKIGYRSIVGVILALMGIGLLFFK